MNYFITGRITPERAAVHISEIELPFLEGFGTFRFKADASQISLTMENCPLDRSTAFLTAKDLALTFATCLGFALGRGYGIELIQLFDGSAATVHGVGHSAFENAEKPATDAMFNDLLVLSLRDVSLRFAVQDFARALISELECPFLCYRAIETVKAGSVPAGASEPDWDFMHATLGSSREAIVARVKPFADPIRHGKFASLRPTSGQDRTEILQITRDVILRYKAYLASQANNGA